MTINLTEGDGDGGVYERWETGVISDDWRYDMYWLGNGWGLGKEAGYGDLYGDGCGNGIK